MSRLFQNREPIKVSLDAHNFPRAFDWKWNRKIDAIRKHWEIDTEWWSERGHVRRMYFIVTTTDKMLCAIYHDLLDEKWYLAAIYD